MCIYPFSILLLKGQLNLRTFIVFITAAEGVLLASRPNRHILGSSSVQGCEIWSVFTRYHPQGFEVFTVWLTDWSTDSWELPACRISKQKNPDSSIWLSLRVEHSSFSIINLFYIWWDVRLSDQTTPMSSLSHLCTCHTAHHRPPSPSIYL